MSITYADVSPFLAAGTDAGPYRLVAGKVHVPGAVAGQVHTPGPTAGKVHVPGAVAGQIGAQP